MKENDSFAEPRFPVRSYGKGELAMYYLPGIAQQTAVNRLNEWIRTAPRAGTTPACHGHEPLLPTVHARAGAAYDQCLRGAFLEGSPLFT